MPAGLFNDSDFNDRLANPNPLEENRALQLALELSMLGLINDDDNNNHEGDSRAKKSQNTTQCVSVPSSEHVAEIVGRQGCKIKALRAKTNTYIKTPVRGEEPVFVVTGRKEDVEAAKKEILSAAEHFSQIRAQRKGNLNGSGVGGLGPNSNVPGQMTIQVRVPYRVVGLVVGPKGATIKRIQQDTNTYIITPSREKEPIFEVTGLPENVVRARKEIEAHIAIRTGGVIDSTTGITSSASNSSSGDSEASSHEYSNDSPIFAQPTSNGFGSLYKLDTDPFTAFSTASSRDNNITSSRTQDIFSFNLNHSSLTKDFTSPTTNGGKFGEIYSSLNSTLTNSIINNNEANNINNNANSSLITTTNNTSPTNTSLINCNGLSTFNGNTTSIINATSVNSNGFSGLCEKDEGIGESPTFDSVGAAVGATSSSLWSDFGGSFPT